MLCGGAVSWRSKKQASVALSSAEAEYMALAAAAQECVWQQGLMDALDEQCSQTQIFTDSQSAIAMANNPKFHGRAKHVDIKYHFVRQLVLKGTIALKYCPTDEMVADVLTKSLDKLKHQKFCCLMNLQNMF